MFLITQNDKQVLSVLQLNGDFIHNGHMIKSRTVRLNNNIIVLQSEASGGPIIIAAEEQVPSVGLSNYASFYVYEISTTGFVKARK